MKKLWILLAGATVCIAASSLVFVLRDYSMQDRTSTIASPEFTDSLMIDGQERAIITNPLQVFFGHNPGKLPKPDVFTFSNARGYVATWRVEKDKLVLTDIRVLCDFIASSFVFRSVMSEVFPDEKEVFAKWFTGRIFVPDGQVVDWVDQGYSSTYAKYIVLRVERGIVSRVSTMNHDEFVRFRDAQFEAYIKTEEYRRGIARGAAVPQMAGGSVSEKDKEQAREMTRDLWVERYTSVIFDDEQ